MPGRRRAGASSRASGSSTCATPAIRSSWRAATTRAGADELVFLDITATSDKRDTVVELARRAADEVFIPFTIGGGIRSVADAQAVLDAGADKVSVNSAALARPELIDELAAHVRRPVRRARDRRQALPRTARWEAYVAGGRTPTGRDAVAWAREGVERGAGEILLTSMDRDGTNAGYDLALTAAVADGGRRAGDRLRRRRRARAPGGGACRPGADAVLCASIFHYGQHTVAEVKEPPRAGGRRRTVDQRRERASTTRPRGSGVPRPLGAVQLF